jgi:membrane fusion protein (multidrug efflux system)
MADRRRLVPIVAGGAVAIAVAAGGAVWWLERQHWVATDNAFVAADKIAVAPQVDGYVTEVAVADNQPVRAGDLLVRIDPASIRARLAQADANAAALEAGVRQVDDKKKLETAMIAQREAGLASAMAQAKWTEAELARYGQLSKAGFASTQREQTARAAQDQAVAAVEQARAVLAAERQSAASLDSARDQTAAQALAARAAVDQAKIDLSRTEIRSPAAGVVGARGVRVGQYVRPGGPLLTVVPLADAYVVANFKETQVARLRIGQPVEIRADAFGDRAIRGRIDSFAPATGAEFALIPVENAVGNFTKIAQRLPVKIVIDRGQPLAGALRPGLSVEVKVDVTRQTGLGFADAAAAAAPAELARRGVSR